ncbi:hypothetical protein GCM10023346_31820 [Arthrobacter gyeryongensis]|uniref:Uncharacterized protein n=1 Tax=Arthrobacter gyeryongensis TaxID=1650592 RepID=A0ABP9SLL3_9MICC
MQWKQRFCFVVGARWGVGVVVRRLRDGLSARPWGKANSESEPGGTRSIVRG